VKKFPPSGRCLATLTDTKPGVFYTAATRKKLFDGARVSPVLDFDRARFGVIRRESAGRISISGIQDKISLRLEKGTLVPALERGDYLLKPIPNLEGVELHQDVPANEHLTMQIAAQVFHLPTAANGMIFFSDRSPAYLTRRFDRNPATGKPLHQEDFCQLSGRSSDTAGPNYKYDSSYEEIGELLFRFCPAVAIEALKLFRLIIFNYIIGNGDAHLKNFSLLESPDGDMVLAPAYDLLNTSIHFPSESRTALEMFRNYETPQFAANGFYTAADFRELGKRFQLPPKSIHAALTAPHTYHRSIKTLVNRSLLSKAARVRYLATVADRLQALAME